METTLLKFEQFDNQGNKVWIEKEFPSEKALKLLQIYPKLFFPVERAKSTKHSRVIAEAPKQDDSL